MKKIFMVCFSVCSVVVLVWILFITRRKPEITIDFEAHLKGKYIVLEARYSNGSKMSIKEAQEILRCGGRCDVILSMDTEPSTGHSSMFERNIF